MGTCRLAQLVVYAAAVTVGSGLPAVVPSPPPVTRMTTVLRHCWPFWPLPLSTPIRRPTSVEVSSSRYLSGSSIVFASSLPVGSSGAGSGFGAAPVPCHRPWTSTDSLLRTLVFAPFASACTMTAVFEFATPLLPPTVGRETFHLPPLTSVEPATFCRLSASTTGPELPTAATVGFVWRILSS